MQPENISNSSTSGYQPSAEGRSSKNFKSKFPMEVFESSQKFFSPINSLEWPLFKAVPPHTWHHVNHDDKRPSSRHSVWTYEPICLRQSMHLGSGFKHCGQAISRTAMGAAVDDLEIFYPLVAS